MAYHAASEASRGTGRMDILQTRVDVVTIRYWLEDERSVIVKLWNRPGFRGWARRLSRTAPAIREAQALSRVNERYGSSPALLGQFRLDRPTHQHTEALVMEDLHPCRIGFLELMDAARLGDDQSVMKMNRSIIRLTEQLIEASILDTDHRLTNMLVTKDGCWHRVDYEHARCVRRTDRHPHWLGEMLGRLLATQIFAVQPQLQYVDDIAKYIQSMVKSDVRVQRRVEAIVIEMLNVQKETMGVDTAYSFPW